jgi:hypothetical protein
MFRFSFLAFVLMYFCGSFFRTSIEEMLFHEALHSFFPASQHSGRRYDGREDRPERTLTRACTDGEPCRQEQRETKRLQHTDDFGENGPLDHRYADPT